jgi:ribosome-associated heat shock protein Hsp15
MDGQRLDRWLWCARLVKTRSLAAKLIEGGKVRVNGERALKVSRHVRLGDVVTGTGAGAGRLFVVRVMGEAERRDRCRDWDRQSPSSAPCLGGARWPERRARTRALA